MKQNNQSQMKYNSLKPNALIEHDEIDLAELWRAIWAGKNLILVVTFIFSVASVVYAIKQPDIYKASVLLSPAGEQGSAGGLAKMSGQLGGLASLAGINLSGGGTDMTGLALEVLKSRLVIEKFIDKNGILVPLMAGKSWNHITKEIIINPDVYDVEKQQWAGDTDSRKSSQPSPWQAYNRFSNLFSVSIDKTTGFITITMEYYSPDVAINWLRLLVEQINNTMRETDKRDAENSIKFLSNKLEQTNLADMQAVFYQLIEEQTKTMMLAEVSKEYVLKTIDPANAPDGKEKPKRTLIVMLGTVLGGIFSVLIVLMRYFIFSYKDNYRIDIIQERSKTVSQVGKGEN